MSDQRDDQGMIFNERDQQSICLDAALIRCIAQASPGGFDFGAGWFGLVAAELGRSRHDLSSMSCKSRSRLTLGLI
ncbi:hypothetical protein EMIT0196MI5_20470 [Pseudomonas sp. IT-196MI5]